MDLLAVTLQMGCTKWIILEIDVAVLSGDPTEVIIVLRRNA
jgi:hypothetical protein